MFAPFFGGNPTEKSPRAGEDISTANALPAVAEWALAMFPGLRSHTESPKLLAMGCRAAIILVKSRPRRQ